MRDVFVGAVFLFGVDGVFMIMVTVYGRMVCNESILDEKRQVGTIDR